MTGIRMTGPRHGAKLCLWKRAFFLGAELSAARQPALMTQKTALMTLKGVSGKVGRDS